MAVPAWWVNDRNRPSVVLMVRLPVAILGMKLWTTPATVSSLGESASDSSSNNRWEAGSKWANTLSPSRDESNSAGAPFK